MAEKTPTAAENSGQLEPGESNKRAVRHVDAENTGAITTGVTKPAEPAPAEPAEVADQAVTPKPRARARKAAVPRPAKAAKRK